MCEDSANGFNKKIYLDTGKLVKCECAVERIRQQRFNRAVEITPMNFKWITDGINSIPEMAKVHPMQPKHLRTLKDNLNGSFYFYGKTGTHKTTFGWALVQEAGRRGQKVGGNSGAALSDTIREYSFNNKILNNASFYSLNQLETNEGRFCLFIDEIETFKRTEYGFATLFELIEKVQAYKHQLIITSNKSIDQLIGEWVQRDVDGKANAANYCEKLARRITEVCSPLALV